MPSNDYSVPSHFIKSDGFSMDNPNQSPRNEYQPISEERRRFLEEKYKRRNLAPESLAIRPELRKLHIATIIFAFGLGGYFALYADFGEKETVFSPIRRYYRRKANEFWSLSEEEKKQLKEQGRL
ncbi:hypothetical protein BGZ54_000287 [Gamsiella multidivaricata]|nr:hypothetical protein BGZ54_000287 [Gamsiella multidivaricata]